MHNSNNDNNTIEGLSFNLFAIMIMVLMLGAAFIIGEADMQLAPVADTIHIAECREEDITLGSMPELIADPIN